jgi:glutamate synthase (NADPH/NADH) small chain
MVHKHTRVDGSEINSHIIGQDKFLPRFNQFNPQEQASKVKHGLARPERAYCEAMTGRPPDRPVSMP